MATAVSLGVCQIPGKDLPDLPRLRINVVGDVMAHKPQLSAAYDRKCKCYKFEQVFAPIGSLLGNADLTIANLETTLPGKVSKYSGYPAFGAPDSLPAALKKYGVDILTLANNHSLDKGKSGMNRTIEVTGRQGFHRLGTYKDKKDWQTRRVLILDRKGIRLALLNYTYGTNGIRIPKGSIVNLIEAGRIKADIAAARALSPDGIVVLYHFGAEYIRQPDRYQKKWVDFALKQGADIVLGGHPHVLQPFGIRKVKDIYGIEKERLIAWSLGNFISNQQRRYTDGGLIFHFSIIRNPDEQSSQKLLYRDISYTPIWVHREYTKSGRSYQILPAIPYLSKNPPRKLNKRSLGLLKRFYQDTNRHLASSMAAVARFQILTEVESAALEKELELKK